MYSLRRFHVALFRSLLAGLVVMVAFAGAVGEAPGTGGHLAGPPHWAVGHSPTTFGLSQVTNGSENLLAQLPITGHSEPASRPLGLSVGGPFPATGRCSGVWSGVGGERAFPGGCHGHDEPSMSFYSDRPGSGGNVSWSFQLPVDGGPSQNQSALYAVAWFGLPLTAAGAWIHECYLEVQFFPDSSWYAPYHMGGQWTVAAIAWQMDPATDSETWCAADALGLNGGAGPAMLNLSEGDRVTLSLTGWPGSPWGENVSVVDTTSGNSSSVTMTDRSTGAPLDPSYTASAVPGAFAWSTSGEFPAAMGFEIGRGSGVLSNNSFGGCSPGPPPATRGNPAVPCPSYDPSSWVNDTLAPWHIHVPTFSASGASWRPTEVAFTSSLGAATEISDGSHGVCAGRTGSAYCSYPWFSFACPTQTFSFGATDFAQISSDFGQYNEYATIASPNVLGVSVYPPVEAPLPACTGSGANLAVAVAGAGSGNFHLLSQTYANSTTVLGIPLGHYRIAAAAANGSRFSRWFLSGGVTVASPVDPVTSVTISGNGTLTAGFSLTTATTRVWFNTSGATGATAVTPGRVFLNGSAPMTVPAGASVLLAPGEYTIQSYPPPGFGFVSWASSGAAAIAGSSYAVAVLNVHSVGSVVDVSAQCAPLGSNRTVVFGGVGNGTVTFNGTTAPPIAGTSNSSATVSVLPGSYSLTAVAAPGWTFLGWNTTPSAVLTNTNATSNVTIEAGPARLTAQFATLVRLDESPAAGGEVSIAGSAALGNGSIVPLVPGSYELDALPHAGYVLSGWSVSSASAAWVAKRGYPITHVQLNSSATITANFTAAGPWNVTFVTSPAAAGTIQFNLVDNYSGVVVNTSVGGGAYLLQAHPGYGYRFVGWNLTGLVSLSGGILTVRGSGGTVRADFAVRYFPVSFQLAPVGVVNATLNGQPVSNGQTLALDRGTYRLAASLGPNSTFAGWGSTLPLTPSNGSSLNATVQVLGSGSITARAIPFVIASLTVSLPAVDIGVSVTWHAVARGTGPFTYAYVGLPPGCLSRSVATLVCAPTGSGTFPVRVNVTAVTGANLTSGATTLLVAGPPTISFFTAAPATVDVGELTGLSVAALGGVGPYTFNYSDLPPGCASANRSTVYCVPTGAGLREVNVTASDVFGRTANASANLTVNSPLAVVVITATPNPITVGIPMTVTVLETGGTTPYVYGFGGSLPGCAAPSPPTRTCVPTRVGAFRESVVVVDATGAAAVGGVNVTVNGRPTIQTFGVAPNPVQFGASVTWLVNASGGTGPLSYVYSGLPQGCSSANVSGLVCAPSAAGIFPVLVTVADRFGVTTNATTTLTVILPTTAGTNPPPSTHSLGSDGILLGAIAVIVVLVVGYALYRRKARPGTMPPAPAAGPPVRPTPPPPPAAPPSSPPGSGT